MNRTDARLKAHREKLKSLLEESIANYFKDAYRASRVAYRAD